MSRRRPQSRIISAFLSNDGQNSVRLTPLPDADDPDWVEWHDGEGHLMRLRLMNHPEGGAPTLVTQRNGVVSVQPPVVFHTRLCE